MDRTRPHIAYLISRTAHARRSARVVTLALAGASLVTLALASGCKGVLKPDLTWHGEQTPVPSGYQFGWRQTALSGDVTGTAVAAAAESVLVRRGYTITDSDSTQTSSAVTASTPNDPRLGRVFVRSRAEGGRTIVEVKVGPIGSESLTAVLIEDMVVTLGY